MLNSQNRQDRIEELRLRIFDDLCLKAGFEEAIHNLYKNYSLMIELIGFDNSKQENLKNQLEILNDQMSRGRYVEAFNFIDNGYNEIDFKSIVQNVE